MQQQPDMEALAAAVVAALKAENLTIATAESCTGGLIAGALTAIAGSSDVVYGGFVTYANEAKIAMVGVPYGLLRAHGAVSKEVAVAMAEGALAAAGTHVAIAVTGIAGPGGGSAEKPVGLVHFAYADGERTLHVARRFGDIGRQEVRAASVRAALELVRKGLRG
jgi:nicotinamide-nucleotide amidase